MGDLAMERSESEGEASHDLMGIAWSNKQWMGYFPLNGMTVMDYFSLSPFYERACNNEIVKMQRLEPSVLQTMVGIEYQVDLVQEPVLFSIHKIHRVSPTETRLLAVYYIAQGVVYQSPTMHHVLTSRLLHCVHNLRKSFLELQQHVRVTPAGKYQWTPAPPSSLATIIGGDERDLEIANEGVERRAVDELLFSIMKKNQSLQLNTTTSHPSLPTQTLAMSADHAPDFDPKQTSYD